ncbi:MAG TPA: hypothetical protein VHG91_14085 [Longimicrobium sp.]|nr:hypothetical protein [Longimicrobium sp.]
MGKLRLDVNALAVTQFSTTRFVETGANSGCSTTATDTEQWTCVSGVPTCHVDDQHTGPTVPGECV